MMMKNREEGLKIGSCGKTNNPGYAAGPHYVKDKAGGSIKKYFCLTVVAVLAISAVARAGYQSGSCTSGSFTVNFSSAQFVTGLGWSTGASRTISFAGSCTGCNLGPIVYGWGTSPLVEYYIGRGGGTYRGSYSTSKGTFNLYTNACNGPNITGTGPFTQYNCNGSGNSGQPMGEHYDGWEDIGWGTNEGGSYCVVMVEGYGGNSGSAIVSVSSSNWYTNWWGSGSATFTCGGGGTLPGQASSPAPANGATGVNTTTDLSWSAGSGATSHDVYFGTTSPGTYRGNQATTTYDTGTMAANTTYYWRIDEKNGTGTTTCNVWSFTTSAAVPGKATSPNPSNGATGVGLATYLSWTAGAGATSHDVYFGSNNPPDPHGNQVYTSYYTGAMAYNTTYYWRIDEKNAAGTTTGDLWSFTTVAPENCAEVQEAGLWLLGDLNGDCYVDYYDLKIIADNWLYDDCSDLNEWCDWADWPSMNGSVDFTDLAKFAPDWMQCNNPQDPNCTPNW
jgi:endo-1,4-beta-xylanase